MPAEFNTQPQIPAGKGASLKMPCRLIGFTEPDLAPVQVVKSSSPAEKTESLDSTSNLIHNAKHHHAMLEELETTVLGLLRASIHNQLQETLKPPLIT